MTYEVWTSGDRGERYVGLVDADDEKSAIREADERFGRSCQGGVFVVEQESPPAASFAPLFSPEASR